MLAISFIFILNSTFIIAKDFTSGYWKSFEEQKKGNEIVQKKLSRYQKKKKKDISFFEKSHMLKHFIYYEVNEDMNQFFGERFEKGRPSFK